MSKYGYSEGFKQEIESAFREYEQQVNEMTTKAFSFIDDIDDIDDNVFENAIKDCIKTLRHIKTFNTHIKTLTPDEYYIEYSNDWHELICEMGDSLMYLDHLIRRGESEEED